MADDPCNCEKRCVHGTRCLGGHANYPSDHWYCCDICTPADCQMYTVVSPPDSVIGIMRACGHAIGPAPFSRVSRAIRPHQLECRSIVAAVVEWAADETLAQDAAHEGGDMLDLTDHIRCFATQPDRRSIVPWPELVPRPAKAMKSC